MTVAKPINPAVAPALQPPGAGLPWWELLAARYLVFPRLCRKLNWTTAARLFQAEGAKILALWDAAPQAQLSERVLIRRLTGIEDSSRYWSAAMTVEHLNIVGFGVREIIKGLRQGELPAHNARIQDVKPRGEMAPDEVQRTFVRLLSEAEAAVDEPPIPPGKGLRALHPWFGPLDAYQWHCLLGIHHRIHRKQLEAILDGLPDR